MSGYGALTRVKDLDTYNAIKYALDLIHPVEGRITSLRKEAILLDAVTHITNGQKTRFTNLLDAIDLQDAVTLRQLRAEIYREAVPVAKQEAAAAVAAIPATTGGVLFATLSPTPAQMRTLNSAPLTMLAAPGAGITNVPLFWVGENRISTNPPDPNPTFSPTVPNPVLRYSGVAVDIVGVLPITNAVGDYLYQVSPAITISTLGAAVSPANRAIMLRMAAADSSNGNGSTFKYHLAYYQVTNLV